MKTTMKEKKDGTIQFEGNLNFEDPSDLQILSYLATDEVQKSIDLLKKNGYIIFKPTYTKI